MPQSQTSWGSQYKSLLTMFLHLNSYQGNTIQNKNKNKKYEKLSMIFPHNVCEYNYISIHKKLKSPFSISYKFNIELFQ